MKNKSFKETVMAKLVAFAAKYGKAMNNYGEALLRSRGLAGA